MTFGTKRSLEAVFITIIGTNIKRLRKLNDLNQTEFAIKIGVSQGSLSDLEADKSRPAIETVISICEAFGCSYEWLLTGKEHSTVGELTTTLTELLLVVKELKYSDQLELLEIAKIKRDLNGRT
jgi:transcriptional regulator with XRE-family HTH domain